MEASVGWEMWYNVATEEERNIPQWYQKRLKRLLEEAGHIVSTEKALEYV